MLRSRGIGASARRELLAAGDGELRDLGGVPIAEVRRLHGMGPKALALLTEALEQQGLSFGS